MYTFQLLMEGVLNSQRNSIPVMIDAGFHGVNLIGGHEVQVDYSLEPTKWFEGWQFPTNEPFITYEPSDESWCRYCGIGREVKEWIVGDIVIEHKDLSRNPKMSDCRVIEFVKNKVLERGRSIHRRKDNNMPKLGLLI